MGCASQSGIVSSSPLFLDVGVHRPGLHHSIALLWPAQKGFERRVLILLCFGPRVGLNEVDNR